MKYAKRGAGGLGVVAGDDSHLGGVMAVFQLVIENYRPRQM